MYDIIIIGGGPAGLTAAVYGLRNGKSVFVIEKNVFGGQICNSPRVENIPGFACISGDEFGEMFLAQAMEQGAEITMEEAVSVEKITAAVRPDDIVDGKETGSDSSFGKASDADPSELKDRFLVKTAEGGEYEGKTVILATGTTHRLLGLPGEEDLVGSGISFCAVCDGDFYRDRTVVMIGGGNSAFVEANLLVETVDKLIMLQDLPFFTADAKSQEQLFSHDNIETHVGCKILEYVTENGEITGVRYEESGEEKIAKCDGVFLAVGLIPDNGAFADMAELNEQGYFASGESCVTKTPGVFVAGDARAKTLRQVATACSDGAIAAIAACGYLRG